MPSIGSTLGHIPGDGQGFGQVDARQAGCEQTAPEVTLVSKLIRQTKSLREKRPGFADLPDLEPVLGHVSHATQSHAWIVHILGGQRGAVDQLLLPTPLILGQSIADLEQGGDSQIGIGDRLGHRRRILRVREGEQGNHVPEQEHGDRTVTPELDGRQFLHDPGRIGGREGTQGHPLAIIAVLLDGRLPVRVDQPPRQCPRFLQGEQLGEHPHPPHGPLGEPGQLDGELALIGLDQLTMETKSLAPGEQEHRALAEAAQGESTVGAGGNGRPFGAITRLEYLDARDRLALLIEDSPRDRAQRRRTIGGRLLGRFGDRRPIGDDRLQTRAADHDPVGRTYEEDVRGPERAIGRRPNRAVLEPGGVENGRMRRLYPEPDLNLLIDEGFAPPVDDPAKDPARRFEPNRHRTRGGIAAVGRDDRDVLRADRIGGKSHRVQAVAGIQIADRRPTVRVGGHGQRLGQ